MLFGVPARTHFLQNSSLGVDPITKKLSISIQRGNAVIVKSELWYYEWKKSNYEKC